MVDIKKIKIWYDDKVKKLDDLDYKGLVYVENNSGAYIPLRIGMIRSALENGRLENLGTNKFYSRDFVLEKKLEEMR